MSNYIIDAIKSGIIETLEIRAFYIILNMSVKHHVAKVNDCKREYSFTFRLQYPAYSHS